MKPSPSQIYHSDFENESLALSTSTAGCKKFRTKVKAMALMNKTNSGFSHSADGPRSHTRLIMHAAFLFYDLTVKKTGSTKKKLLLPGRFVFYCIVLQSVLHRLPFSGHSAYWKTTSEGTRHSLSGHYTSELNQTVLLK